MTTAQDADFVFVPFGGVGEIGMNLALYGYGPARARKWLMVDCGLGFPRRRSAGHRSRLSPTSPSSRRSRSDLVAICITHAHEDHIGALVTLVAAS